MPGPQLNTPGIQLNIDSLDPAFFFFFEASV